MIVAVDNLSKHVHGRENTIIEGRNEQDAVASAAIEVLGKFFDTYDECRSTILGDIQQELADAAVGTLLTETIQGVDELATHHSVDEVYVGDTSVLSISAYSITIEQRGLSRSVCNGAQIRTFVAVMGARLIYPVPSVATFKSFWTILSTSPRATPTTSSMSVLRVMVWGQMTTKLGRLRRLPSPLGEDVLACLMVAASKDGVVA